MLRKIYFWHGPSIGLNEALRLIPGVCEEKPEDFTYYGSIDSFLEHWKGHGPVMILASGTICITQYSNFGQR